MFEAVTYSFASVLLVSAISFAGVFTLTLRDKLLKSLIFVLVSMSAGALFGDAFLHLIPEAFGEGDSKLVALAVVAGIMLFFILEKFLAWRHSHGSDEETLESARAHDHTVKSLGPIVLFADAVHNFIDGVVIAASFLVSTEVGIATVLAVVLHEIPQEIGDFGLLLHSGYSRGKALFYNFLSALTAIIGAALVFMLGGGVERALPFLLAFTAGGFIYIAGADLVPEIQKTKESKKSLVQVLCMIFGVGLMVSLLFLG